MASALLVVLSTAPADAAGLPSCPNGGPCVIVQVVDGQKLVSSTPYTVDQIDGGDIQTQKDYPLSGGGTVPVRQGATLASLAAGVSGVKYAEVMAPDTYGRHPLTLENLGPAGANGFQGNLQPAFYSYGTGQMNYIRPLRGDDDQNNTQGPDAGNLFSDPDGALVLVLHTSGQLLDVTVTAQPVDGSDRSYTLTTDQPGASTFDWVLPDRSHQSGASITYAFGSGVEAGTYAVGVAVDAPDGSFGWGTASLRAGPAPAPTPSASATGGGGQGKASNGPTRKPTRSASGEPRPGSSEGTGTAAPTSDPTGSPTLPSSSGPTLPPATGSSDASAAPSTPAPTASASPTSTPTSQATGDAVTGLLLAAAQPVEAQPSPSTVAEPPSTSADAAPIVDPPFGVPVGVLVALGGLLLLAAGALSESERVRHRLRRWVGRRWVRMGG